MAYHIHKIEDCGYCATYYIRNLRRGYVDILKYPEDIGWHTISTKLRIADIVRHTISAICGEDMWISMDIEDVAGAMVHGSQPSQVYAYVYLRCDKQWRTDYFLDG
jgi:hypothetical protein